MATTEKVIAAGTELVSFSVNGRAVEVDGPWNAATLSRAAGRSRADRERKWDAMRATAALVRC